MADATITFGTLACQTNRKIILVDQKAVELHTGNVIEFRNDLTGNPDMILEFYEVGSTTPIAGFCTEMDSADQLPVPGASGGYGVATCTLAETSDVFAYTAETAPGTPSGLEHEELDPVIIITPSISPLLPFLTTAVGQAVGLGLAVVLILAAWVMGVRKGQQDRTAPAA